MAAVHGRGPVDELGERQLEEPERVLDVHGARINYFARRGSCTA
jgi:hypothetical protein